MTLDPSNKANAQATVCPQCNCCADKLHYARYCIILHLRLISHYAQRTTSLYYARECRNASFHVLDVACARRNALLHVLDISCARRNTSSHIPNIDLCSKNCIIACARYFMCPKKHIIACARYFMCPRKYIIAYAQY